MQQVAERDGFRRIFLGWPNIGGRYRFSPISGWSPRPSWAWTKFLDRTEQMVCACMPSVPVAENPGVMLGTILGVAAREFGRDKMTIVASPPILISALGWSSWWRVHGQGRQGVDSNDREPLGKPDVYGRDRLLVYLRLSTAADTAQDAAVDELERAGHPVICIAIDDPYDLGEEFFR